MIEDEDVLHVPFWLKITIGVVGMAAMMKLFYMAELFNYFLMIVCAPIAFISFFYVAADGVYDAIVGFVPRVTEDLRARVDAYEASKLQREMARANAYAAAAAAHEAQSRSENSRFS
jgi:hypothetical protein